MLLLFFPTHVTIVCCILCPLRKFCFQPKRRSLSNEFTATPDTRVEQTSSEASELDVVSNKDGATLPIDNDEISSVISNALIRNEEQQECVAGVGSVVGSSSGTISNNEVRNAADREEVSGTVTDIETIPQTTDAVLATETSSDGRQEIPSSPVTAQNIDIVEEEHPVDSGQNVIHTETSAKTDKEDSIPVSGDAPIDVTAPMKDADVKVEPHLDQKNHQENQNVVSPLKVQDQLDEVKYVNNEEILFYSELLLLAFELINA